MIIAQNSQDPTYSFRYSTGNDGPAQIWREERKQPDGTIIGKYGYIDPNGEERVVEYTASPTQFLASGDVGPDAAAMRYAAEQQQEHLRERAAVMREWQQAAQRSPPASPWDSRSGGSRYQSQGQRQKTNPWSNQQQQPQAEQVQDLPEPPSWAQQEVAAPPPPIPAAPLAPARKMAKGSRQGTSQLTAWNSDWNKNQNQWNSNWNSQPASNSWNNQPATNNWDSGNNWNQQRPARTSWNDSPQEPWKDMLRKTPPAPSFQRQQIQRRSGSNPSVPSAQLNSLTPRNWPKPQTQSQPISAGPFSYSFEISHADGSSTSYST